jgi:hypothetical protein
VPSALPTFPVPKIPIFIPSFSFAEVFTQRPRDLRGVGALLKTNDDTLPQRPDVSEARLESSTGRLCSRRVFAKGDDAVAHFKEFVRFSVPVLKVSE